MKKTSLLLLVLVILMSNLQVFAYTDLSYFENQVRNKYENDSEFLKEKADLGENWANNEIKRMANRLYKKQFEEPLTRGVPDAIKYVSVTNIKQTSEYNCGPANALIAITTAGRAGAVAGISVSDKIKTLESANNCATDSTGSYVYKVKNAINNYMTLDKKNYVYNYISNVTDLKNYIYNSLNLGYAAILHADTSYLSYWDNYSAGHYITVYGIDLNVTNQIISVTDTYDGYLCNNSPYLNTYGKHNVSLNEVFNSVNGRYLICYQ